MFRFLIYGMNGLAADIKVEDIQRHSLEIVYDRVTLKFQNGQNKLSKLIEIVDFNITINNVSRWPNLLTNFTLQRICIDDDWYDFSNLDTNCCHNKVDDTFTILIRK